MNKYSLRSQLTILLFIFDVIHMFLNLEEKLTFFAFVFYLVSYERIYADILPYLKKSFSSYISSFIFLLKRGT